MSIVDDIIAREGSAYTDRPADKGGPTKYGITLSTLRLWRQDPSLDARDVQNLQETEARQIYVSKYVAPFMGVSFTPLRQNMIDWGVTSGADDPTRAVQKLVGTTPDGQLGPKTLAAINSYHDPDLLALNFAKARVVFYVDLVQHHPAQLVNLEGWVRRALEFFK